MQKATELAVALDFSRIDQAQELVDQLEGLPVVYKVGLELFATNGPVVLQWLRKENARVFLDLKLYDIPNTVAQATKAAANHGVEWLTLHLSGGREMWSATVDALEAKRPCLLGVSVLTSFDGPSWKQASGTDLQTRLLAMVENGVQWGMGGVVCSAQDLRKIKERFPSLYSVTPGIRPDGAQSQDQKRTVTPKEARDLGANMIVVGRPITQAPEPRRVVEAILRDLQ